MGTVVCFGLVHNRFTGAVAGASLETYSAEEFIYLSVRSGCGRLPGDEQGARISVYNEMVVR